ncbi:hypothetical protein ACIBED_20590 [Rhodococcus coprophilus]|uniref:hypothetical protein n=1 Tax=Rhodococcus coprophilus TaxID=38310 RepID=UPI0037B00D14
MSDVQLSKLTLGARIGDGGQGKVYELVGDSDRVFKQYHQTTGMPFSPAALDALIAIRDKLTHAGRPVDRWAAWPSVAVRSGGDTVGFLMPRVPIDFTFEVRGKRRLAELGALLAKKSNVMFAGVTLPNLAERVAILRNLAGVLATLHEHSVVVGDLSFANVLWARTPEPRVMLIDCDGTRLEGVQPVLPQADTGDWEDPYAVPGSAPTVDRDCYKLALAVLRVLGGEIDSRPTQLDSIAFPGLDSALEQRIRMLLKQADGPVGTRPTARAWETAFGERATVQVQPGVRRTIAGPQPKPEMLGTSGSRQFRPVTPPKR